MENTMTSRKAKAAAATRTAKTASAPKPVDPASTPAKPAASSGSRTPKAYANASKKKPKNKVSGLEAAAQVLAESKQPMNCKDLVETMASKGYWTTKGKTPASTIYSAIIREISTKGKDSRFRKAERGMFATSK
jgi:hypothetical protein